MKSMMDFYVLLALVAMALGIGSCNVYIQYQTCEAYYPEVSKFVCVIGTYGAPQKKERK